MNSSRQRPDHHGTQQRHDTLLTIRADHVRLEAERPERGLAIASIPTRTRLGVRIRRPSERLREQAGIDPRLSQSGIPCRSKRAVWTGRGSVAQSSAEARLLNNRTLGGKMAEPAAPSGPGPGAFAQAASGAPRWR